MLRRATVSTLGLVTATVCGPLCASAQDAVPAVRSIDIYGSSVVDSAAVRAELGPDLLRYVELGWQAVFNGAVPENAAELEAGMRAIDATIRAALESRTPLAYFEIGVTLLPELAPYLRRINDGARRHEDEVYAVAADSTDASKRATALFVRADIDFPVRDLIAALDPAYEILTAVSGEDRDYAWERWAASR